MNGFDVSKDWDLSEERGDMQIDIREINEKSKGYLRPYMMVYVYM